MFTCIVATHSLSSTPLCPSDLQCPLFMAMSEVPLLCLGFISSPCICLQLCQKYMLLFSYRLQATHSFNKTKKTHTPLSIVLFFLNIFTTHIPVMFFPVLEYLLNYVFIVSCFSCLFISHLDLICLFLPYTFADLKQDESKNTFS